MYLVRFSSMKAVEHHNAAAFDQRVGRWLLLREAENSYLLGEIPKILNNARAAAATPGARIAERMFTVEDADHIVAVALLLNGGCLCMTWATDEIADVLAEHLANAHARITSTFAPGHVSWRFAQKWSELNNMSFEFGRSERVYQVSRLTHQPHPAGNLALATEADTPFLRPWVNKFLQETAFELTPAGADGIFNGLLRERALYIWRNPQPAAMAAWVAPTPNGGAINFVFTPPELRRNGHARDAVAAMARRQLAAGKRYCFILTDTLDENTNRLYQSIGARTLCELLRCTLHAKNQIAIQREPTFQPSAGKLNAM